jgi:hypothetical protein
MLKNKKLLSEQFACNQLTVNCKSISVWTSHCYMVKRGNKIVSKKKREEYKNLHHKKEIPQKQANSS